MTTNERMIMKIERRDKQDRSALGALSPLPDLNRIRSEINRLFEDPLSLLAPTTSFFEGSSPAVDVFEDPDKFVVKTELPGMKKEEINVSLVGDTLTISGERKREEEQTHGETYRSERYFGRFQRTITLSAPVDPNRIDATYKDGVLSITLPKSEEAKPKQIQVKTQ